MIPILVARTSNGQLFTICNSMEPAHLRVLREKQSFSCPQCFGQLILKAGSVRTPHFAHRHFSSCSIYSEPESPRHLAGKSRLYGFFQERGIPVRLEVFIPSIAQRADIQVQDSDILEYQCSPITKEEIARRTNQYEAAGFHPVWLFGTPAPQEEGIRLVRLKAFEQEAATRQGEILFFDPETALFTYVSNLYRISATQWAGKVKTLPLNDQVYPFARPKRLTKPEFTELFQLFEAERDKFFRSQSYKGKSISNPVWRTMYRLGYDPKNLPWSVGIPIEAGALFRCHLVEWQLLAQRAAFDPARLPARVFDGGRTGAEALSGVMRRYKKLCRLAGHAPTREEAISRLYAESCKTVGTLRK